MDGIGLAEMHLVGCHQPNTGVVVVLVVSIKEAAAEGFGVFDVPEVLGEPGLVFQGFEVGLRVRGVVGRVRPATSTAQTRIWFEVRTN